MENKNMPAYPVLDWDQLENGQIVQIVKSPGLSKREYFAVKAMQGLMAVNEKGKFDTQNDCVLEAAKLAVMAADALIAELSKS